jgi:LmbE family N-acetylglucosaminyl deacetylase
MPPTALSLLAHPDDAEILCGGTLIRLADAGWQVHVASMTPGDCGTMDKTPWEIAAIRTAEARSAAEFIGASYHCLNQRDGMIVHDRPTMQAVIDLFRRINPSLLLIHAASDYMVDHEITSRIARSASFIFPAPNASTLPVPSGARVPHLYYCDPIDGVDALGQPVIPGTFVDIGSVIDRKLAMLAKHESQRAWLRAHHGIDEYLDSTRAQSARRGAMAQVSFAEGFIQHRGHAYPGNDLLAELFPIP